MKLKWKNKTAVLTFLEVWSSGGITRAVIRDSIRGLVTLEYFRRNVLVFLQQNTYFGLVIVTCISWCKISFS